jgi:hypothetical protein
VGGFWEPEHGAVSSSKRVRIRHSRCSGRTKPGFLRGDRGRTGVFSVAMRTPLANVVTLVGGGVAGYAGSSGYCTPRSGWVMGGMALGVVPNMAAHSPLLSASVVVAARAGTENARCDAGPESRHADALRNAISLKMLRRVTAAGVCRVVGPHATGRGVRGLQSGSSIKDHLFLDLEEEYAQRVWRRYHPVLHRALTSAPCERARPRGLQLRREGVASIRDDAGTEGRSSRGNELVPSTPESKHRWVLALPLVRRPLIPGVMMQVPVTCPALAAKLKELTAPMGYDAAPPAHAMMFHAD